MCKCKMAAICKFYEPVRVDVENDDSHKIEIILPKKRGGYKKKSQGRGKGKGNRIKLTTSEKDIKRVRIMLRMLNSRGSLTEEQMAALDSIGTIHYKTMRDVQKQQLLDIYYGPRRTKNE